MNIDVCVRWFNDKGHVVCKTIKYDQPWKMDMADYLTELKLTHPEVVRVTFDIAI